VHLILIRQLEKPVLKFVWKHKRFQIAKTILSKKSNVGGVTISDFILYDRAIVRKTAWYWHNTRQEDHEIK
jgi:hypothetical protein